MTIKAKFNYQGDMASFLNESVEFFCKQKGIDVSINLRDKVESWYKRKRYLVRSTAARQLESHESYDSCRWMSLTGDIRPNSKPGSYKTR